MTTVLSTLFRHTTRLCDNLVTSATDFVFPYQCSFCGNDHPQQKASSPNHVWCLECEGAMAIRDEPQCQRCAAVVGPYSKTEKGCVHCRDKVIRFDSASCLGMYDGPLRKAVLSSKWSWSSTTMLALSRMLVKHQLENWRRWEIDGLTVIPQSFRRRWSGHFHAADVIAREISRALNCPIIERGLHRVRHARPQKRVALSDRYNNQKNSMTVMDSTSIAGRKVLIVDDVLTTGATASEASRALKQAGAKACHVAVLARVLSSGP